MPEIPHSERAHQAFRFSTRAPAAALAPYVEHSWIIHWDLRGRPAHEQRVLPYPAVNVTFLPGRCQVTGVVRGRFAELLTAGDSEAAALLDRFLTGRAPARPDPAAETVETIMAQAAGDPTVTRVDQLVGGLGARSLQRLFAEYVGVGPKWVIRRYRLHEAAAAAEAAGGGLDVGTLAARLGYADQAHLTRDFTAVVGEPPARYARAQTGLA